MAVLSLQSPVLRARLGGGASRASKEQYNIRSFHNYAKILLLGPVEKLPRTGLVHLVSNKVACEEKRGRDGVV